MAKILFGGPEGDRTSVHDDLVARLKQEHAVTYAREADGAFFLYEAMGGWPLEKKPDIILYDTGFFYPNLEEVAVDVQRILISTSKITLLSERK